MPYDEIYTARTAEEWLNVQGCGSFWDNYKNGELWYFGGWICEDGHQQPAGMWYLATVELNVGEVGKLREYEETL